MSNALETKDRTLSFAQMSRPTSSVFGKNSVNLKTSVPDEVDDAIEALMRDGGYPSKSDFLRELILVALYGSKYVQSIHEERLASLGQNLDVWRQADEKPPISLVA